MSFSIEPIKTACKERGTTFAAVERACGLSNGAIAKWENAKGSPQIAHLILVAEHLEKPLDYIIYGEREKTAPITEDGFSDKEKFFMRLFRQLPADRQDFVIEQLQGQVLMQTVRGVPEE